MHGKEIKINVLSSTDNHPVRATGMSQEAHYTYLRRLLTINKFIDKCFTLPD